MRVRAARYLGAAKKAISALKDYYQNVLPDIHNSVPARRPNPEFPYPTKYTSLAELTIQPFEYLSQLEPGKLVFCGKAAGNLICIKFARQYSKETHLECTSLGFAPALRGFETLAGGWSMVVMDYLGDEYELLANSPVQASFLPEVREKVISLHQLGYVHGDIRTTNIMVKKSGEPGVMFIDFDWAGIIGTVRYPMNVNTEEIKRPDGAIDGELIVAEHDMAMVDFLSL
jgi:serine/threonine protein kinase